MKKIHFLFFLALALLFIPDILFAQQLQISQKITVPELSAVAGNQLAQISGNQAIYGDSGNQVVYIFEKNASGQWSLSATLTHAGTGFGSIVGITHDRAIISGEQTYIYEKKNGTWQQATLITEKASAVAIDGDYAMVGLRDAGEEYNGAVDVYKRTGSEWQQVQRITNADNAPYDFFGDAIVMDGERAAVSADVFGLASNKSKKPVYSFARNDAGVYTETGKITYSCSGDGCSSPVIDLNNEYIVNSDPGYYADGAGGYLSGHVAVYHKTTNDWEQVSDFQASDESFDDFFGIGVTLDQHILAVQTKNKGTYVYTNASGAWQETQIFRDYNILDIAGNDAIAFGPEENTVYFFKKEAVSPEIAVTSFSLIDGRTNEVLQTIENGSTLNLYQYKTDSFDILVHTSPETVGSVQVELRGVGELVEDQNLFVTSKENNVPYNLFEGDNGDAWKPDDFGPSYRLIAIPYAGRNQQGSVGKPLGIHFILNENAMAVTGFSLIDADHNKVLRNIDDGDMIDLNNYDNKHFNIIANTENNSVGSVKMELTSTAPIFGDPIFNFSKIENNAPYALLGDIHGDDFRNWEPEGAFGFYDLTATAYSNANANGVMGGSTHIQFHIKEKDNNSNDKYAYPSSPLTENEERGTIKFVLVDADNNTPLQTLEEGDVVNLGAYTNQNFNIRVLPREYYSWDAVRIELSTNSLQLSRYERIRPYTAFGDNNDGYRDWEPELGKYTLTAAEYVGPRSNVDPEIRNSWTIHFRIIDNPAASAVAARTQAASFKVYPNPAISKVTATMDTRQGYNLSVFDHYGKLVYRKAGSGQLNESIQMDDQQPGLYMVVLEADGKRTTRRLMLK